MRKITKEAVEAFLKGCNFKSDNTEVNVTRHNVGYYLHDNLIALKSGDKIEVSLAGWNTKTTRERLNGIPGVSIHTVKGVPILNGQIIEDDKFYTV
jgi:hypothetical protein